MPYRDREFPSEPEVRPRTIREVYDASLAAVEHFQRSCPNGLVKEPKEPNKSLLTPWVVKHGPRFLIDEGRMEMVFCCPEQWDDLWSGRYLPIPWRWFWKRRVKKLDRSMFRETPLARPR
jgi:hypothetical protein